jgi:hypothetical protein
MRGAPLKLAALAMLVLVLAGCAARESGTGSGGDAGTTVAEEETTVNGSEETTVYKEETTVLLGGIPEPPDSTLSYGGREVKGTLGSYCWSSKNVSGCADTAWPLIPSKQKTLSVPPGSEMVFRYGGHTSPNTVEVRAYSLKKLQKTGTMHPDRSLKAHGPGVQRTIPAELSPGECVLEVFITEQQGDASYYFRVMVE